MKRFLGLIFLLLFLGCSEKKNPLVGVWYSCTKNGVYYEMHIDNNSIEVFVEGIDLVSILYSYQLEQDTLILRREKKVETVLIKIEANSLEWKYSSPSNGIKSDFLKFPESIEPIPKMDERDTLNNWLEKVISDMKKRSQTVSCPEQNESRGTKT